MRHVSEYIHDLRQRIPRGGKVLSHLHRAGLNITNAWPVGRSVDATWLLYGKLDEKLAQTFGLRPEILVVLVPAPKALARDVEHAEEELSRSIRLDKGAVLLIARDPEAAETLQPVLQQIGRTYAIVTLESVCSTIDMRQWLHELLIRQVGQSDLFVAGRPVLGVDFIGRTQELRDVRRRLLQGHPVGLFGLRKVGKTSMLQVLCNQFAADARRPDHVVAFPILLDTHAISFAEANQVGFARLMVKCIYATLRKLGLDASIFRFSPEPRDPMSLDRLSPDEVEGRARRMLECLITWSHRKPSPPPILLLIDEYEKLYGDGFPVSDGLAILNYCRGLVQQNPKVFNFLVAGLDHRHAAISRIGDAQNPLFNFLVEFPLSGMARSEMNQMIRTIGKRLSLEFEDEALDVIWEESGGHPFLAREFGSVIHKQTRPARRTPTAIGRADATGLVRVFRLRVAKTMEEIHRVVLDVGSEALTVLRRIQQGPDASTNPWEDLPPEVIHRLYQLGILNERDAKGSLGLRIGSFGAWLGGGETPAGPPEVDSPAESPDERWNTAGAPDEVVSVSELPAPGAEPDSKAALEERILALELTVGVLTEMLHSSVQRRGDPLHPGPRATDIEAPVHSSAQEPVEETEAPRTPPVAQQAVDPIVEHGVLAPVLADDGVEGGPIQHVTASDFIAPSEISPPVIEAAAPEELGPTPDLSPPETAAPVVEAVSGAESPLAPGIPPLDGGVHVTPGEPKNRRERWKIARAEEKRRERARREAAGAKGDAAQRTVWEQSKRAADTLAPDSPEALPSDVEGGCPQDASEPASELAPTSVEGAPGRAGGMGPWLRGLSERLQDSGTKYPVLLVGLLVGLVALYLLKWISQK